MKVIEASVTRQGQVIIPEEIRRRLGLSNATRVSFVIDGDRIELVPIKFDLESVRGSIPSLENQSSDFDREIEEAMDDRANEVVVRFSQS